MLVHSAQGISGGDEGQLFIVRLEKQGQDSDEQQEKFIKKSKKQDLGGSGLLSLTSEPTQRLWKKYS